MFKMKYHCDLGVGQASFLVISGYGVLRILFVDK
jgi:hypothetical protein